MRGISVDRRGSIPRRKMDSSMKYFGLPRRSPTRPSLSAPLTRSGMVDIDLTAKQQFDCCCLATIVLLLALIGGGIHTMDSKKSEVPPDSTPDYHPSDSDHTDLSDRIVSSHSSPSNADPPPYTPTAAAGLDAQPSSSTAATPIVTATTPTRKPIGIPAIEASFDSPFVRAYAPMLADYNLPRESFFTFLDQLNKVISGSPPLQVLDATGGILQSVPVLFPLHWLGSAVSGLANLGSHGVSKSRTDSYLRQANQDIFRPRGLKAEITRLDALAYLAHIPILDSRGKVNRQSALFHRLRNEATSTAEGADLRQQQVTILQPWIAELEFEVLPWTSRSRLTRFNAALKKRNAPVRQAAASPGQDGEPSDDAKGFRQCLWLVIRPEGV